MRGPTRLALAGAFLLAGAGMAAAQTATQIQYPPPGYGQPGYGQPGYGPPPGYPPPPPPGYGGPPGYPPPGYRPPEYERERGFRCEATLRTPRGLRTIICPLEEPRSVGRRCECPPPPPPPGFPPFPPADGRVIR
jgi:hypothetical protein